MASESSSNPRPCCPAYGAALVLSDATENHYHWRCGTPACDGSQLESRGEPLSAGRIARDIADKRSRAGAYMTSDERRKDQTAFRRMASSLSKNHRLFDYLSRDEHQALETASRALRKLARASKTAKGVQARREVEEKKALEREQRDRQERLFREVITQEFDPDTVLLRCEALEDYIIERRGFGEGLAAYAASVRKKQSDRSWSLLVHQVGQTLDQEMWGALSVDGYYSYWPQWKAGLRYRNAISQAQARAHNEGNPDE